MKATNLGNLNPLNQCEIIVPKPKINFIEVSDWFKWDVTGKEKVYKIVLNNLPEISDTKNAIYNNEGIIGRSAPLYTYSHSGDRTISLQIHLFALKSIDCEKNLQALRIIQSALYPRNEQALISAGGMAAPYKPPPICKIKCGNLLARNEYVCVFLQSYSVKFPTDVAWDETTYCPYRFDIDTTWTVCYTSSELPWQNRIIQTGYI